MTWEGPHPVEKLVQYDTKAVHVPFPRASLSISGIP